MIVFYKPEHLDLIELRSDYRALADGNKLALALLGSNKLATTVVSDDGLGAVIAVLGGVAMSPDECEVFMFPSMSLWSSRKVFWRGVKQELERIRGQFKKVSALSADTEMCHRFFSHLGFVVDEVITRDGKSWLRWVAEGVV